MLPYLDPDRPVDERVEDLLARMTLAEKAGQLFHATLTMNGDGTLTEAGEGPFVRQGTTELVAEGHLTHFNLPGRYGVRETAEWVNRLQTLAADTRLSIPVTLSTDPRHAFTDDPGASSRSGAFSVWPEPVGLAAIGEPELVEQFGNTVRREYLSVGFRVALHPRADLSTEPRRPRRSGMFGSSVEGTSALVQAYVRGLQGPRLGHRSVAAMVKHSPSGMRDLHLAPSGAAIEADRSQGIEGIVCTDWGLLGEAPIGGETRQARDRGVEHLTVAERAADASDAADALHAGADRFGGEQCPEAIVRLVRSGRIPEERVDACVRRLLRQKFVLGLFEHRYVDPDRAEETVGAADFTALGEAAQRRSLTVLTNHSLLPLSDRPNLYVEGLGAQTASLYGNVVADPAHADVAVLRLRTPYDERPGSPESSIHSGSPAFGEERLKEILALLETVPTLVCVRLERPVALPEIAAKAAALVADYGASDAALLDVAFGRARAEGRLPFELPRSTAALEASRPDGPDGPDSPDSPDSPDDTDDTDDTEGPVFPYGHGLAL
ncbi:glycoside hydrolase family 3 N-terminal domain-containing protein [Streptomyces sp. NPDC012510]|uniref:glycoside hydrolase family 3 protein n=1 Tax=Streptomyces sp. NPDC012510 TaxID=3364838 RepID=UPI0036DFD4F9